MISGGQTTGAVSGTPATGAPATPATPLDKAPSYLDKAKAACAGDSDQSRCETKMPVYFQDACDPITDTANQKSCYEELTGTIETLGKNTSITWSSGKYAEVAKKREELKAKFKVTAPAEPSPPDVLSPPVSGTSAVATGWIYRVETLIPISIDDDFTHGVGIGATPVNVDGFTDHRDVFGFPWLRFSAGKTDGLQEWGASLAYAYGRPRNDNYTPTDSTSDLFTLSFYGRKNFQGLWEKSPNRIGFLKGAIDVYATTGPVLMSGNMVGTQQIMPGALGLYGVSLSAGIQQDAFFASLETAITGGQLDTTLDPATPSTTYIHLGTQEDNWPVVFLTGGLKF